MQRQAKTLVDKNWPQHLVVELDHRRALVAPGFVLNREPCRAARNRSSLRVARPIERNRR